VSEPIEQTRDIDTLIPHPRNYNQHPPAQIERLAASLRQFGQVRPIVVHGDTIVAGHGVYLAAQHLGYTSLRVTQLTQLPDDWTEEQALAYLVADNETRRGAEPDDAELAALLDELQQADFDIAAMGFDDAEYDALLEGLTPELPDPGNGGDEFEPDEAAPCRVQPGDVWLLGGVHRLICGDCTDPATVERLMQGERADAVVTDPPYAFGLASTSELNTKAGGWADMMNNSSWYADLYRQWVKNVACGPIWCCINWRTLPILMRASIDAGVSMESLMIWDKSWIGPGGLRGLRPSYEMIALTLTGSYGIPDRGVPDILTVPASSHKEHGHKAEKPVDLFIRLLDISSVSSVYDPFLGSGTTIIAAHRTGRRCYGCEISPEYCEVILQRCEAEGLTVEKVSTTALDEGANSL
jgi:DNA modification methylase